MEVTAHPLVVAVAMGLLGPGVLAEDAEDSEDPCIDCQGSEALGSEVVQAPPQSDDPELDAWKGRATPSADAQARALAEYLALTQG